MSNIKERNQMNQEMKQNLMGYIKSFYLNLENAVSVLEHIAQIIQLQEKHFVRYNKDLLVFICVLENIIKQLLLEQTSLILVLILYILLIVGLRWWSLKINQQQQKTTFKLKLPKRLICNIYEIDQGLIGLTQTSIRSVIGAFTFQDLLEKRSEIQIFIKEFLEPITIDWGVEIEAIMIRDIQMDEYTQNVLAKAATEKRAAQAKILNAQFTLQSTRMMKEAAEMLNSKAAMQIRFLEVIGIVGSEAQTQVVII
ncbi:unnamed protein product [Paramecium primaurelia]|uniref:Band 7 domain-containing protein n=1 Tax=Paramecium primaurelia TaxID=5886 RepID=A0A8S1NSV1_PARPR|nr:unnamed protein product [Paramecium primaurelia]